MSLSVEFSLWRFWLLVGSAMAPACQEPGGDWVTTDVDTTVGSASTGGPITSDAANSTATSTTTAGSTAEASASDTTGMGGSTGAGAASSASDAAGNTASTTSDTGSGGSTSGSSSGGSGGSGGGGGSSGDSLIPNGDFSSGESGWGFEGNGSVDTSGGEYCVTFSADGTLRVSWPNGVDAASLSSGASYQLGYQVYYSGSAAPSLTAKVGQAFEPYNPFVEESVSVGTAPMPQVHTFSVQSDEQAGVLFTIDGSSGVRVCFDDVVLRAQ